MSPSFVCTYAVPLWCFASSIRDQDVPSIITPTVMEGPPGYTQKGIVSDVANYTGPKRAGPPSCFCSCHSSAWVPP